MRNTTFVSVVWGEAYTRLFLDISLPTQLSIGNLPVFSGDQSCEYRIYTPRSNAVTIEASSAFQAVTGIMRTRIIPLEDLITQEQLNANKYVSMAMCHSDAVREGSLGGKRLVFISPDTVWGDGAFKNLAHLIDVGKKTVMMAGLRLDRSAIIAEISSLYPKKSEQLSLPPRDLVKLALKYLHLETRSLHWNAPSSNNWPSMLIWGNNNHEILVRAFHMHPLLITPPPLTDLPDHTIDGDFVLTLADDSTMHIVTDTDEICGFELTEREQRIENIMKSVPNSLEYLTSWTLRHANEMHRRFVKRKIWMHSNGTTSDRQTVEIESNHVLDELFSRIRLVNLL